MKDRKETFASHNAALDKIQKSLEEYLETKRAAFPRFYFLSNDELVSFMLTTRHKTPEARPRSFKMFSTRVCVVLQDTRN